MLLQLIKKKIFKNHKKKEVEEKSNKNEPIISLPDAPNHDPNQDVDTKLTESQKI